MFLREVLLSVFKYLQQWAHGPYSALPEVDRHWHRRPEGKAQQCVLRRFMGP